MSDRTELGTLQNRSERFPHEKGGGHRGYVLPPKKLQQILRPLGISMAALAKEHSVTDTAIRNYNNGVRGIENPAEFIRISSRKWPQLGPRLKALFQEAGWPGTDPPEREEPPASTSAESESPSAMEPSPAAPPRPALSVLIDYLENTVGWGTLKDAAKFVFEDWNGGDTKSAVAEYLNYLNIQPSVRMWERSSTRLQLFKDAFTRAAGSLQRPAEVLEALRSLDEAGIDKLLLAISRRRSDIFPPVPSGDNFLDTVSHLSFREGGPGPVLVEGA